MEIMLIEENEEYHYYSLRCFVSPYVSPTIPYSILGVSPAPLSLSNYSLFHQIQTELSPSKISSIEYSIKPDQNYDPRYYNWMLNASLILNEQSPSDDVDTPSKLADLSGAMSANGITNSLTPEMLESNEEGGIVVNYNIEFHSMNYMVVGREQYFFEMIKSLNTSVNLIYPYIKMPS
jgi:hypothetical protein